MKDKIFWFILGGIVFSSIGVYAAIKMQASEIGYGSTTVEAALNELRSGSVITKVAPASGETHKGIVYLDPTDITKKCNASNSASTTETKTGCMKWYIFDDSGTTYKMILDHNTTARIKWNDDNINVAYEQSNLKAVVDDLVTTSKWEVTPRLITTDEIVTITGKTDFSASNGSSWYYLETNNKTQGSFTTQNRSRYDWLYNNLTKCKTDTTDWGCSIEDNNSYTGYGTAGEGTTWSYWTSTPVGTAGEGTNVFIIIGDGRLGSNLANTGYRGIRPVIEISKSLIK